MKKQVKVVMLPTEKASSLWINRDDKKIHYLSNYDEHSNGYCKAQHLYLVSDEEIKEGDWFIEDDIECLIFERMNSHLYSLPKTARKIIATTDTSLHWEKAFKTGIQIPNIPQSFIEAYVKANGEIDEVMVEYEFDSKDWQLNAEDSPDSKVINYCKLKLREDNTVIIHKVKSDKMYSKEEVIKLAGSAWEHGDLHGGPIRNEPTCRATIEFDKWIEENL